MANVLDVGSNVGRKVKCFPQERNIISIRLQRMTEDIIHFFSFLVNDNFKLYCCIFFEDYLLLLTATGVFLRTLLFKLHLHCVAACFPGPASAS